MRWASKIDRVIRSAHVVEKADFFDVMYGSDCSIEKNGIEKALRNSTASNSYAVVEKVCFSGSFLQDLSRVIPFLQGPSCRKSPSALFRFNWVKCDHNRPSDRKKRFFSIIFFDPIGDRNPI